MNATVDAEEYSTWVTYLFPSDEPPTVGAVSVAVGAGLYLLGLAIGWVGNNVSYLVDLFPFLASVGIAGSLAWLGWADGVYADVWDEVRPAFAVDDETYHATVRPAMERVYHERRILGYWVALALPLTAITVVVLFSEAPLHPYVENLILQSGYVPFTDGNQSFRLAYYLLFEYAVILIMATALNGFVVHLSLVRSVSSFPFRDLHTAAADLEPVARFTITSATAWFTGVTVVFLAFGLGGASGPFSGVVVGLLVFVGVAFFLAPQLLIHDALDEAKQARLAAVRAEYEALDGRIDDRGDSPEGLSMRLELTDRRLENAKAISTWVYDLSSLGTLAASAVVPWLTLLRELLDLLSGPS